MTPDDPDTLPGALRALYKALSLDVAEAVAGKKRDTLHKWADPDQKLKPCMETVLRLECEGVRRMCFTPEVAPISAMWRRTLTRVTNRSSKLQAVCLEAEDVHVAAGDLARAVRTALDDHTLSAAEKKEIRQKIYRLHKEIDDLARSLDESPLYPLIPQ